MESMLTKEEFVLLIRYGMNTSDPDAFFADIYGALKDKLTIPVVK